jgi:serine/threonine protein kinase
VSKHGVTAVVTCPVNSDPIPVSFLAPDLTFVGLEVLPNLLVGNTIGEGGFAIVNKGLLSQPSPSNTSFDFSPFSIGQKVDLAAAKGRHEIEDIVVSFDVDDDSLSLSSSSRMRTFSLSSFTPTPLQGKDRSCEENPPQNVAVKFLKSSNGLIPLSLEVSIMRKLNHPNLLSLLGVTPPLPTLGVVLEFAPYGDLSQLIETKRKCRLLEDVTHATLHSLILAKGSEALILEIDEVKGEALIDPCVGNVPLIVPYKSLHLLEAPKLDAEISWKFRIRILSDVACGMKYLNSLSPPYVHRDLRSPNIFLFSLDHTVSPVAKIGDFGLAIANGSHLVRTLRTWQWMAPGGFSFKILHIFFSIFCSQKRSW